MVTYDEGDNSPSIRSSLFSRVFSTRHKTIGLQYLWLSLASVLVGMVLSAFLRIYSSWPGAALPFLTSFESSPERFAAVRLLHGSLMIFFVLIAAPQLGFQGGLVLCRSGRGTAKHQDFGREDVNRLAGLVQHVALDRHHTLVWLRARWRNRRDLAFDM